MFAIVVSAPLKRKCHHFDEIFVTGYPGSSQMTTSSAANDEHFVKMTLFPFQADVGLNHQSWNQCKKKSKYLPMAWCCRVSGSVASKPAVEGPAVTRWCWLSRSPCSPKITAISVIMRCRLVLQSLRMIRHDNMTGYFSLLVRIRRGYDKVSVEDARLPRVGLEPVLPGFCHLEETHRRLLGGYTQVCAGTAATVTRSQEAPRHHSGTTPQPHV